MNNEINKRARIEKARVTFFISPLNYFLLVFVARFPGSDPGGHSRKPIAEAIPGVAPGRDRSGSDPGAIREREFFETRRNLSAEKNNFRHKKETEFFRDL